MRIKADVRRQRRHVIFISTSAERYPEIRAAIPAREQYTATHKRTMCWYGLQTIIQHFQ